MRKTAIIGHVTLKEVLMNKEELVKEVSKKAKVSQKAAADVIAATLETVEKTVAKGQKVTLVGFGTFEPRKRAARSGRNPQTGATIRDYKKGTDNNCSFLFVISYKLRTNPAFASCIVNFGIFTDDSFCSEL